MPKELQPVPPWVQFFSSLNPDGVEIIEMTDPIVTGMASVDQPIQERIHESVYLLRNGLTPDMVKDLESIVGETFPAIAEISSIRSKPRGLERVDTSMNTILGKQSDIMTALACTITRVPGRTNCINTNPWTHPWTSML